MFSLIITIISIVLVGLLAVATIYYGGDAFSNRGDEARADKLLNEGQQLAGASVLAANDGNSFAAQSDLVTGEYINAEIGGWTFANGVATQPTTPGVCAKVTEKVGTSTKITCVVDAVDPALATMTYSK